MLDAFDEVPETLVGFGEFVHDPGHRGAVPRVLGFVVDPADEAGGVQSQFGADRGPADA